MNKKFGEIIRDFRRKAGMTQAQLAKRLGISPSAVGMYEQGRREPDHNMLMKLCEVFNTTSDRLLGMTRNSLREVSDVRDACEINDLIDEFGNILSEEQALMFNGMPIDAQDKQKIIEAIRVAAAVAVGRKPFPQEG